jgi:hypothetical protein
MLNLPVRTRYSKDLSCVLKIVYVTRYKSNFLFFMRFHGIHCSELTGMQKERLHELEETFPVP